MALHYTRKNDETTERDVPAEDFVKKMVELKRIPDEKRKVDNIESVE